MMPNEHGMVCIEIPEVNRVEIDLADELTSRAFKATSATRFSGYLVVGSELRPLPVGSTLDPRTGRFSWMPGPGFLGTYELIFVRRIGADPATKVPVRLTITPKR
jgi:hypothetical protein